MCSDSSDDTCGDDRVTSEKQRKTDYVCEDILDVDGFIPDNGIGGNKA